MARKAKIDNAILKRFARKEARRLENTKNERTYILIVCEGEKTEPFYFNGLKNVLPKGTLDLHQIDVEGTGKNTISLIEHSIKVKEEREESRIRTFDQVWAVFDKDDFTDHNFNNAITKAEAIDICCDWSNEAFELWYLLHFEFLNSALSRTSYKKKLEVHIQKASGNKSFRYSKNADDMYELLKKYGDEAKATRYAFKLEEQFSADRNYAQHNPCTRVHHLMAELNKLKEL